MPEPATLTVVLPNEMLDAATRRARELQFHDLGFYVRWLVAKDALPESEDANLEVALIHEGLASGPGRVADEAFYRELTEETDRIIRRNIEARAARAAG